MMRTHFDATIVLRVAIAVVLTLFIRHMAVGGCLVPVQLERNERAFIVFDGLKGAVPILLGEFLRAAHIADAERMYFFFSSRRRHTRFDCDWSSDVCSSD